MPAAHLMINNLTISYDNSPLPAVTRLNVEAKAGELLALLGPSGSGKSTTLRAIAGFVGSDPGSDIRLDGQSLLSLPPERRDTALVFQQPTLFPHMTVAENIGFGLLMRCVPLRERKQEIERMLHAVQLEGYGQRRPFQISGGQRQRVALARALVTRPRLLLLDEPFAALDPELRDEMRALVRRLQREQRVTTILVTHDQQEAALLADRIALLMQGQLQQLGPPESFYSRPANLAVARFFGAQNFLTGLLEPNQRTVVTALGSLTLCQHGVPPGPVTVVIRPEHIQVETAHTTGEGLLGRICDRQFLGGLQRYTVTIGQTELSTLTTVARFDIGEQVRINLPAEHLWALPAT